MEIWAGASLEPLSFSVTTDLKDGIQNRAMVGKGSRQTIP
jgi:hypothetical protein